MTESRHPMDALDLAERDGVVGIWFIPASGEREDAAIVAEVIGGPKRYARYWIGAQSWTGDLLPDWGWVLPDDAILLWEETDRG